VFESSCFVTRERWSSHRVAFASPTRASTFCLPSLVNTSPGYLNLTCFSVLPLTRNVHCLGFLERHNPSVFSVMIFIPALPHAAENRSSTCWRSCSENVPNSPQIANGRCCSLQTRRFGCCRLSNSSRRWRGVVAAHTLIGVHSNTHGKRLWFQVCQHGLKLMCMKTVTWRPVTGSRQHRTPATFPKAFHQKPGRMLSRVQQNMCKRLWHAPRFLENLPVSKNWSVVLRLGRKQHWVSPNFCSIISRYLVSRHLAYTFPGRLRREMQR